MFCRKNIFYDFQQHFRDFIYYFNLMKQISEIILLLLADKTNVRSAKCWSGATSSMFFSEQPIASSIKFDSFTYGFVREFDFAQQLEQRRWWTPDRWRWRAWGWSLHWRYFKGMGIIDSLSKRTKSRILNWWLCVCAQDLVLASATVSRVQNTAICPHQDSLFCELFKHY